MDARSISFLSPYPPAECAARLKPFVRSEGALFVKRPLVGFVTETKLQVRKRTWQRRSGRNTLVGSLEPHDGGTIIRARFGLHPTGIWIMRIYGGILAAFMALAIIASIDEGEWRNALLFGLGAAVVAGIVLIVVKTWRWAYSVDPSYVDFFKRVLGEAIDAREA
jgi:hypothetical protein